MTSVSPQPYLVVGAAPGGSRRESKIFATTKYEGALLNMNGAAPRAARGGSLKNFSSRCAQLSFSFAELLSLVLVLLLGVVGVVVVAPGGYEWPLLNMNGFIVFGFGV